MLTEANKKKLEEIILAVNPEVFIVDISLKEGKRAVLSIKVDTDSGISLDTCTRISRKINTWLEEDDIGENAFFLEVSSPGVGFPLKLQRQYPQNMGRIVEVKLRDGQILKGKLIRVDQEYLQLDTQIQSLKGKKKKAAKAKKATGTEQAPNPIVEINFHDIREAKVVID